MNANHERWKQAMADSVAGRTTYNTRGMRLGHAVGIFGARAVAAVRSRARRRGARYAAEQLRAAGIGLGMARLLILGRP